MIGQDRIFDSLSSSTGDLIVGVAQVPMTQIAAQSWEFAQQTKQYPRILVWSDDLLVLLRVICASQLSGADLYIAHRTLSESLVRTVLRDNKISLWVRDHDVEVLHDVAKGGNSHACIFVMTSGTTDTPKIAEHTASGLVGNMQRTSASATSRWLLTYPATSFAGLQVVLSAVIGGATLVQPANRFAESFARMASAQEITHISGTPTFWRNFLLALGPERLLTSLRQITLGGEVVDQPTLDRLALRFPSARISQIYASTEVGVLFTVNDGRAGIPAHWIETGIVDDVRLRIRAGVLEALSPRRMTSYVSSHTAPVTSDGWVSTGDLVQRQQDRYVFVGRADRRLNVGGFKVSPEEVEQVLLEVPGVTDTCVFGANNPISGQVVAAEIVAEVDVDLDSLRSELLRHARGRLEAFKIPRVLRFVDRLAIGDSGKKLRRTEI